MKMTGKRDEDDHDGGKILCGGGIDYFYVLPEGCVAAAISFTGPRDACRLSSVSKMFKSAADSDSVWTQFLPSDYREILARSDGGNGLLSLLDSMSKRDLFFYLVNNPLLLDGSTKSFSLDKTTGKKCYTIASRELDITWADTPRYWAWRSSPESRFPEVAELHSVCWLEIRGKLKASMLTPDTNYAAYFIFKMAEGAYGFYAPAEVTVKTAGGKSETQTVYLEAEEGRNQRYQIVPRRIGIFNRIRTAVHEAPAPTKQEDDKMLPKQRGDGWMEVEVGRFLTRSGEDGEVEVSVTEVKAGNWKSGLIVEGIEFRPIPVPE